MLIGIRRSGKSVILKQIIDELKENNVDDNHIIYINFEDYDYEEYTDPKKLNNYVKERIIKGKYKYYLTDLGFTNILSEGKKEQIGAYLENIVYNELIARGYNVNIGTLENGKIDFIATRFNKKIYIQVAYILSDETVIDREFNAYKRIEDNYPKYVLSMDKFDLSQNGIIHKNIIDWLLKR